MAQKPSPDTDPDRAARIRALRGDQTQPQIAERAGVTLRAYQAWEAGAGIGKRNREPLAKALNTTVAYLMHGDRAPSSEDGDPDELVDRLSRQQEILRRVASNRLLTAGQLEYLERVLDELEHGQPSPGEDATGEVDPRAA